MFKIESDILTKAVSFVSGIVSKSQASVSPVLQNVKFTFDESGLKLETTNTDISCVYTIDQSAIETKSKSFSTTVPALKLNDILKKLGNEKLSCKFLKTSDKEVFVIKTGKFKSLLDCLPSNIYPSSRNLEYTNTFNIKASNILNAINRVKFSVCTDEARFYINGILLDMAGKNTNNENSINIVSTDSHRLSIQSINFSQNCEIPQIIIPRRSIQKIVDLLLIAKDEDVAVNINKTKIKISFGGCSVSSNLIEGEFPQYQRVIPQNPTGYAIVSKTELLKAINTVSAMFSGTAYNVVKLTFIENNLTVEASRSTKNLGSDIGIGKYIISCESSFNEPFVISYNYSYINDCLNAFSSPKCKINFTEASKPCLITPIYESIDEDKKDENEQKDENTDYKFVIMPIRL